jgi:flagellar basal body-associated protein FliL
VIVPIIPPYLNSNRVALEVKGWIYIIIVISIIAAGTVYYFLAFGYRQKTALNTVEPKRSIVRWGRAVPRLREDDTHEPQYGVRRLVDIHYESEVSLPCSDETVIY